MPPGARCRCCRCFEIQAFWLLQMGRIMNKSRVSECRMRRIQPNLTHKSRPELQVCMSQPAWLTQPICSNPPQLPQPASNMPEPARDAHTTEGCVLNQEEPMVKGLTWLNPGPRGVLSAIPLPDALPKAFEGPFGNGCTGLTMHSALGYRTTPMFPFFPGIPDLIQIRCWSIPDLIPIRHLSNKGCG